VSAAVSPANNATFPIGSIVVQSVAKSLLILINRGDMNVNLALALALSDWLIKREAKMAVALPIYALTVQRCNGCAATARLSITRRRPALYLWQIVSAE
jgi:hypothetical protein